MDPFERQFDFRKRVNYEALAAYVVGAIVAFVLHRAMGLQVYPPNTIFTMLIVVGVGGLWYHLRKIV